MKHRICGVSTFKWHDIAIQRSGDSQKSSLIIMVSYVSLSVLVVVSFRNKFSYKEHKAKLEFAVILFVQQQEVKKSAAQDSKAVHRCQQGQSQVCQLPFFIAALPQDGYRTLRFYIPTGMKRGAPTDYRAHQGSLSFHFFKRAQFLRSFCSPDLSYITLIRTESHECPRDKSLWGRRRGKKDGITIINSGHL